MKKLLTLLLMVGFAGQMVCADEFDDLATYKYGVSGAAEKAFNKVCVLKAEEKPAVEQKLIAVLSNKDATEDGKVWACRCLQLIGTDASVPALSGLLKDEVLSTYARLALERMVKSEAAGKALRDALTKTSGDIQVGIAASLGLRRDADAVKDLAKLAGKGDVEVAKAALMALGKIADGKSADSLIKMDVKAETKQAHMDALIECAARLGDKKAVSIYKKALASDSDQHRAAGLVGMCFVDSSKGADLVVSALQGEDAVLIDAALNALVNVKGDALTSKAVSSLEKLTPAMQAKLITVLGARGDKAALKSVVAKLSSEDEAVQAAALMAVSKLGDAGAAKILMGMDLPEKMKAEAITQMVDPGVNAVIIDALKDSKTSAFALAAVEARNCKAAVPVLMGMLKSGDADVRKKAWAVLGSLAGEDDIAGLVKAAQEIKDKSEVRNGASAISKAIAPLENKAEVFPVLAAAYDKSGDSLKVAILGIGATVGGAEALELERKALKSGNEELVKTAVKALGAWNSTEAAEDLFNVAKNGKGEVAPVLALRGYIAMAGSNKMKLKPEERMEMLTKAQSLAKRVDEKKAIIGGLRAVRNNDAAFKMLSGYIGDEALKGDVEGTANDLIRHSRNGSPEALKMAAFLAKSENKRTRENVERKIKEWEKNKK